MTEPVADLDKLVDGERVSALAIDAAAVAQVRGLKSVARRIGEPTVPLKERTMGEEQLVVGVRLAYRNKWKDQ